MAVHNILYICFSLALTQAIPEINIVSDNLDKPLSITFRGCVTGVISDDEKELLELTDARLLNSSQAVFNKKPSGVYLHDPTPWGNQYNTFGWPEVQTKLSVLKTDYNFTDSVIALSNYTFSDQDDPLRSSGQFSLGSNAENLFTSEWSGIQNISLNKNISYNIAVGGEQYRFSYINAWGEGHENTQLISIKAMATAEFTLPVGESIFVELLATRRNLHLNVDYILELQGRAFVNFEIKHKGHHFYGSEINHLLRSGGYPISVVTSERMTIRYFISAKLDISTVPTRRALAQIPAVIECIN